MKRKLIAAFAAAAFLCTPALAQQPGMQGGMMGPGMQGGMMGPGMQGGMMGPGMMGPGMMGPGMMGGMMGRGMMGRGMMGQRMGPGAMLEDLGLSDEQQSKIQKVHDELRQKHWDLMGRMMQEDNHMRDAFSAAGIDRAAAEKAFRRMNELREQMFAARLDAHAKLEALLTPEQQAKLRQHMRHGGWRMMMH